MTTKPFSLLDRPRLESDKDIAGSPDRGSSPLDTEFQVSLAHNIFTENLHLKESVYAMSKLPLKLRKDIRDYEPKFAEHASKMSDALGGAVEVT